MDITKSNVDEQMARLRDSLKDINLQPEDLTIHNTGAVSGTHSYESILTNGVSDTITLSGFGAHNNTMLGGVYSNAGPYTINTSVPANAIWSTGAGTSGSGKITLNGDNADVEVNGWSLVDAIKRIEERLNLLRPNANLEAEWEQLRELGDQYRALEAQLKEQTEMWDKLRAMPPPPPLT